MQQIIDDMKEGFEAERASLKNHINNLQQSVIGNETNANYLLVQLRKLIAYCVEQKIAVPPMFARFAAPAALAPTASDTTAVEAPAADATTV